MLLTLVAGLLDSQLRAPVATSISIPVLEVVSFYTYNVDQQIPEEGDLP